MKRRVGLFVFFAVCGNSLVYPSEPFRFPASYFLAAKSNQKPPGESKNLRANLPGDVVFWVLNFPPDPHRQDMRVGYAR